MTLFEIIIICIVATMFVATIFMFTIYIKNIKKVNVLESKVIAMSNVAFECRCFLEKLSKHDVITKINNISGLEKKIGEVIGICKNQTNNITQVKDNLDKTLDDIKKRNNLISDNHKLLDNINGKIVKIQNSINYIEEFKEPITYIKEKLGEVSIDSEKEVANINKNIFTSYEDIKEKLLKIDQQYTIISNSINATSKFVKTINDELNNFSDAINNVIKNNKINNDEIAKIGSILDSYREKVNYIATWIENATKLKTATKTKSVQTKTTKTPIIKK